jgi:hypothetical protein
VITVQIHPPMYARAPLRNDDPAALACHPVSRGFPRLMHSAFFACFAARRGDAEYRGAPRKACQACDVAGRTCWAACVQPQRNSARGAREACTAKGHSVVGRCAQRCAGDGRGCCVALAMAREGKGRGEQRGCRGRRLRCE